MNFVTAAAYKHYIKYNNMIYYVVAVIYSLYTLYTNDPVLSGPWIVDWQSFLEYTIRELISNEIENRFFSTFFERVS